MSSVCHHTIPTLNVIPILFLYTYIFQSAFKHTYVA